ncbi:MAG: nuclear transport factor 2 family protein [Candidatus Eremiobacteraeota bacterium]|nr:nuclear transport factor 2 family protein [Candidatus Eremiobacteraeota bacterium]
MTAMLLAVTALASTAFAASAPPTPSVAPASPNAAQLAQAHKADAQRAIEAGNAAYVATWRRGDAHAFAQLYTPNAASIADDGTITRGRTAIEAARAASFARARFISGTISTEDLVVEDDVAYEMGSYSFTLQPAGKSATTYSGRYLTIWQQQPGGSWLIKTDSGLTDRTCKKNA